MQVSDKPLTDLSVVIARKALLLMLFPLIALTGTDEEWGKDRYTAWTFGILGILTIAGTVLCLISLIYVNPPFKDWWILPAIISAYFGEGFYLDKKIRVLEDPDPDPESEA